MKVLLLGHLLGNCHPTSAYCTCPFHLPLHVIISWSPGVPPPRCPWPPQVACDCWACVLWAVGRGMLTTLTNSISGWWWDVVQCNGKSSFSVNKKRARSSLELLLGPSSPPDRVTGVHRLTSASVFFPTPLYFPPEISARGHYGPRSPYRPTATLHTSYSIRARERGREGSGQQLLIRSTCGK